LAQILVTGGTGTLGRVIVGRLVEAGWEVRVLSRRPRPGLLELPYQLARGDLRTGVGVDEAVADAASIIHCATGRDDVAAARNLIGAARRADTTQVVYISIVGVDRVPLGYYRSKLQVEGLLEDSALGYSVLRTTQFHDLIAAACRTLARSPIMVVPADTSFQPISVAEVAERLVELAEEAPAGRVPDMGGPEVLPATQLAQTYLHATARHRFVRPVRFPGKTAAGYRRGAHLTPARAVGRVSFQDYLANASSPDLVVEERR